MLSTRDDSVDLKVLVQPRARRSEIVGPHGDRLRIRVQAPPSDGRANEELILMLADAVGLAPSRVEVVRGHTARAKRVRFTGTTADRVARALGIPRVDRSGDPGHPSGGDRGGT